MKPVNPANQNPADAGGEFEAYRRLLAQPPAADLPASLAALEPGYTPRVALRQDYLESEVLGTSLWRQPKGRRQIMGLAAAAILCVVGGMAVLRTLMGGDGLKAAVVYAGGDVVVMQPAPSTTGSFWPGEDLNSGSLLKPGAVIMTGPESAADIALAEGVVLRLKEKTRLKVEELQTKHDGGRKFQIYVEYGRLLAVAEGLQSLDEFQIVTPDAFAQVRQTAFRISADDRGTIVHMLRGGMEIRSRAVDGTPAIVEAHQVAQVQATDERPLLTTAPGILSADSRDSYEMARRITGLPTGSLAALGVGSEESNEVAAARQSPANPVMSQLEFKDGSRIQGRIVGQRGQQVFIEAGSESLSFSTSDIKGIEYLSAEAGPDSLY